VSARVPIDHDKIAKFGRGHSIRKLSLFGSGLCDDLRPNSDEDAA
jgi:hypothetical protein